MMKETKKQMIIRLIISNLMAVLTFFALYRIGLTYGIQYIEKLYIVPLILLIGILAFDNYKEVKQHKIQSC